MLSQQFGRSSVIFVDATHIKASANKRSPSRSLQKPRLSTTRQNFSRRSTRIGKHTARSLSMVRMMMKISRKAAARRKLIRVQLIPNQECSIRENTKGNSHMSPKLLVTRTAGYWDIPSIQGMNTTAEPLKIFMKKSSPMNLRCL